MTSKPKPKKKPHLSGEQILAKLDRMREDDAAAATLARDRADAWARMTKFVPYSEVFPENGGTER